MGESVYLNVRLPLVVAKRGGGQRTIRPGKWWINRRTELGEDADIYEIMPHGGNRWIPYSKIIGQEGQNNE